MYIRMVSFQIRRIYYYHHHRLSLPALIIFLAFLLSHSSISNNCHYLLQFSLLKLMPKNLPEALWVYQYHQKSACAGEGDARLISFRTDLTNCFFLFFLRLGAGNLVYGFSTSVFLPFLPKKWNQNRVCGFYPTFLLGVLFLISGT